MTPLHDATHIVNHSDAALLDFDGPVCSVFSGTPAEAVAARLRYLLIREGVALSPAVRTEADPLAVLRFVGSLGDHALMQRIDDELRTAELAAIESAAPTPHADDLVHALHQACVPVAVVSNNSEPAIKAYLNAQGLARYVAVVVGRQYGLPTSMKPSPELVRQAVAALGVAAADCVLIGDSPSDIQAARSGGVRSIGFANKPGKREALTDAGADAILDGPNELGGLAALVSHAGTHSRR